MVVVLHLDDGVRDPLFGHLVSDDTFDASVDLSETAERLKACGTTDGRSSVSTDPDPD